MEDEPKMLPPDESLFTAKRIINGDVYFVGPVHGHDLVTNEDGSVTETYTIDGEVTETTTYAADESSPLDDIFPQWMRDAVKKAR